MDLVTNVLRGKSRNTFGQYLVMNKNPAQLEIWGYDMTDDDNVAFSTYFQTPAEASIEFMGGHEYYWFPYKSFLMARLSDGRSFKFYRFDTDFKTNAA